MTTASPFFDHASSLNTVQRRYLQPLGPGGRLARRTGFAFSRLAVRSLLKLGSEGLHHLPPDPPFILAPSHTSSLDPFVLSAVLPYRVLCQTHWAAAARAILRNRPRRLANRLAGSVPIGRGRSALAVGAAVLERGKNLVWFPEGTRTRDGQLQELRPGIGLLAVHSQAPVVPIRILGGYEAMPPGRKRPRYGSRVTIRFGKPLAADPPTDNQDLEQQAAAFTRRLHEALVALGESR